MVGVVQVFQILAASMGIIGATCIFSVYYKQTPAQIYDSLSGNQSWQYGEIEAENYIKQNATNQVGWMYFFLSFLAQLLSVPSYSGLGLCYMDAIILMLVVISALISLGIRRYKWVLKHTGVAVHKMGAIEIFRRNLNGQVSENQISGLVEWSLKYLQIQRLHNETNESYIRRVSEEIDFEIPTAVVFPQTNML